MSPQIGGHQILSMRDEVHKRDMHDVVISNPSLVREQGRQERRSAAGVFAQTLSGCVTPAVCFFPFETAQTLPSSLTGSGHAGLVFLHESARKFAGMDIEYLNAGNHSRVGSD